MGLINNQHMTKSQIDKLGDLLRAGQRDDVVYRMMADLYASYADAAFRTHTALNDAIAQSGVPVGPDGIDPVPVPRTTKTLASIVAKLARERMRLSAMQDIIGCRIVVSDRRDQEILVSSLGMTEEQRDQQRNSSREALPMLSAELIDRTLVRPFAKVGIVNRNMQPSYGYRAIHIVIRDFGPPYEIQVRTAMQDRWANFSERLNDFLPGIKYGEGAAGIQAPLIALSDLTAKIEEEQYDVLEMRGPDVDKRFVQAQELRMEAEIERLKMLYDRFEEEYLS
jgi:ppGpp synthetase/RelA/SpoT-type nucleotidyltranferase